MKYNLISGEVAILVILCDLETRDKHHCCVGHRPVARDPSLFEPICLHLLNLIALLLLLFFSDTYLLT